MTTTTTSPYLVTTARDGALKLHRSTCKKAQANAHATTSDTYDVTLNGRTATPATCCKPRPLPTEIQTDPPTAEPVKADTPTEAAAPKVKRRSRVDVLVRFVRDGKPMPDSQNKLASVAYYHTRDVTPGEPRCSTDRLREILAEAGVADPEAKPWGPVTLANGVVLGAVAL